MFSTNSLKAGADFGGKHLRTAQQQEIIRGAEKMEPWKLLENFVTNLLPEIKQTQTKEDFEKKKIFLVNELKKVSDGKSRCTMESSIDALVEEIRGTLDKVLDENEHFKDDVDEI